jgi:outer membrane lipoprotein-sorting protein
MRRRFLGFAALAGVIMASGTARAESADQVLERMDKTINGYQDQFMAATMTVIDTNGKEKKYDFSILQKSTAKGDQKRLIRFTSGEQKGMATLVEDPSHVYVFLPGFKKSRRVASHAMNQSIAGSDMSNADMAFASWPRAYACKIDHEDATYWWLDCTARPGGDAVYPRAVNKVRKDNYMQDGVDYYDASNKKVKYFDNSHVKDYGGGLMRNSVVVIGDPQTGHKTRLDVKEFKANQGVKDDTFTVRELEWGQ